MKNRIYRKTGNREAWLELRRTSVGGSEAAAVMGEHDYTDAYALWCEKRGIVPVFRGNEATRLGTALEDYAARRFAEIRSRETGKRVRVCRCNRTVYNPRYPQAHANLDRLVVGEKALLECKTTGGSLYAGMMKAGEIPRSWYWQLQHYLAVTDLERAYLIVVDRTGREKPRIETVSRSEADIERLMTAEAEFMDRVRSGEAPAPEGLPRDREVDLVRFPGSEDAPEIQLPPQWQTMLGERDELKESVSQKEKRVRAIDAQLQSAMGNSTRAVCGDYRITWKRQNTSAIDQEALRRDYPEIRMEKYRVTGRVMRVRKTEKARESAAKSAETADQLH